MHDDRRLVFCLVVLLLTVVASGSPALGQGFGPDAYGIPSNFGMAMPTSTRQLGMGTVMTCLVDVQCANPAFAAAQQFPDAGVRVIVTELDRGPRVTSAQFHYMHPLRPDRRGLAATALTLDASGGNVVLPGIGAVPVNMSEDAMVVDYGVRVTDRLSVGMAVLGFQNVGFSLAPPVGPKLLDVSGRSDYGARVGLAYEWAPGDYLGLIYSYAQTTVNADGLLLGGPVHAVFHGDQLALGASRHLGSGLLGVAEYHHGGSSSGPLDSSTSTWHFGVEYQPTGEWALRAGLTDENPTFGFGYDDGRWRADYSFIRDWNERAMGQLFGGSETHSLQMIGRW